MKKQKPKRRKNKESGPVLMRHPFSDIDPDVLRTALIEMAKRKTVEFPDAVKNLTAFLRTYNPFHLLSVLAAYGLTAAVREHGGVERISGKPLEQHHIELLQAFLLAVPVEEVGDDLARPDVIQQVIDLLDDVATAFHQRRLAATEQERDLQGRTLLAMQEQVRMHTQMVRNWGYFSDVVAISRALYGPFDAQLREVCGFSAAELIKVAQYLVSLLESRMTERIRALQRVFRERKVWPAVKAYYKAFPDLEGKPEELMKVLGPSPPLDAVRAMILSHSDLRLVNYGIFSAEEVENGTGISAAVVVRIMSALALKPGSLAGSHVERFFMGNPIWRAPVIAIGQKFYCCIPQSIFSHIHDVMKALCESAGLKTALEERRAEYLEDAVHKLLRKALPGATLLLNAEWKIGTELFETDHLALMDKTLLIVEDKSAALSESGLRGAPDRIKRHIQDLILAPSEQSTRFEKLIRAAQGGDVAAIESLKPLGLPLSAIDRILRVSVTLDDFSVISSAERQLKEAGWIPVDAHLAPTIAIADFGVVVDITAKPHFFFHYLSERSRIQKAIEIVADEVDYLGLYLATGFNISQMERGVNLVITGMSQPIDHYYDSADAGVKVPKPKPKLSPYFEKLLNLLERRRPPGWLSWAADLLSSASYDEQKRLERMLDQLRAKVRKNWRDPSHECSVVCIPPEGRDTVIIYFVFPPQLSQKRKELAEHIAGNALDESGRHRCLIISRRTDRWDDPYAFIGKANKDKS